LYWSASAAKSIAAAAPPGLRAGPSSYAPRCGERERRGEERGTGVQCITYWKENLDGGL
jgi:hypothetical protein